MALLSSGQELSAIGRIQISFPFLISVAVKNLILLINSVDIKKSSYTPPKNPKNPKKKSKKIQKNPKKTKNPKNPPKSKNHKKIQKFLDIEIFSV
jgi:hypothetical protein